MRVLAVGNRYPPAAAGGYERIFAATVAALRAAGHEVRVLVPPELEWYWREDGFPALPLRLRATLEGRNATTLREVLAAFRPDVVSWWGMGGMSLSLIEQVRRAGVPAVGVVGDGWMVYGPDADKWTGGWRRHRLAARLVAGITRIPTRLALGRGARWLFISEAVRERVRQEGVSLPDTGIVHPGVDPALFAPRPAEPWAWRLACVGRVEPRKGIAVAIEALAGLPEEATLTVDGPVEAGHRHELAALAVSLGVIDRVRFACSESDRVAAAYAAADAVLFPVTWAEPWGLVPLEAMSVGRPVVASGTGGSAEYLANGVNALIAPPGDVEALVAAVRRLADEGLRRRLVEGGRETAARYSSGAFEAAVVGALEEAARTSS